MTVQSFEFNMFGEKTYIVYDPESREAAIIDPGTMNRREEDVLFKFVQDNRLIIKHIILTHQHIDHVMGLAAAKSRSGADAMAHPDDSFLGKRIAEQVQMFHLPVQVCSFEIDHKLKDGDHIAIGGDTLEVISVPGHSPGSIALYSAEDNFVITGDALFQGSIGRTDLPGGDYPTLIKSINERLLTLPDSTVVYPGHGPSTTIGYEKKFNPYF